MSVSEILVKRIRTNHVLDNIVVYFHINLVRIYHWFEYCLFLLNSCKSLPPKPYPQNCTDWLQSIRFSKSFMAVNEIADLKGQRVRFSICFVSLYLWVDSYLNWWSEGNDLVYLYLLCERALYSIKIKQSTAVEELLIIKKFLAKCFGPRMFIRP